MRARLSPEKKRRKKTLIRSSVELEWNLMNPQITLLKRMECEYATQERMRFLHKTTAPVPVAVQS